MWILAVQNFGSRHVHHASVVRGFLHKALFFFTSLIVRGIEISFNIIYWQFQRIMIISFFAAHNFLIKKNLTKEEPSLKVSRHKNE